MSDYIGKPIAAYNGVGNLVWQTDLDIFGKVRTLSKGNINDCPFRYQGQYHDTEVDLYYNRFRYYSPESGMYVSQDPIKLKGNNANIYAYVHNSNSWVDTLGLYEIALGLGKPFDYNRQLAYDTNSVADPDWQAKNITKKFMNDKTFAGAFDKVAKDANAIHFAVDGLDPERVKSAGLEFDVKNGVLQSGNVTSIELNKILNDDSLFKKTKFYQKNKSGDFEKSKLLQPSSYLCSFT